MVKLCQYGVKNVTAGNSYDSCRGQTWSRLNQKPSKHSWDMKHSYSLSEEVVPSLLNFSEMSKNSCYMTHKPTFQADAVSTEGKMGNYE